MPTWERVEAGSSPRSRSRAFALIERSHAPCGSSPRGQRSSAQARTCLSVARVDREDLVHRRAELGAELLAPPVAPATRRPLLEALVHRRVVGDVAGRLLEVGGEATALQNLGEDVADPLAGEVGAAELRDRVVAVADEDPLVELRGALALGAVEGTAPLGSVGRELVEVEPPQRALVAGVAGEQRALDGLGQIRQREHRPVEVAEVRFESDPLRLGEGFDRVIQGADDATKSSGEMAVRPSDSACEGGVSISSTRCPAGAATTTRREPQWRRRSETSNPARSSRSTAGASGSTTNAAWPTLGCASARRSGPGEPGSRSARTTDSRRPARRARGPARSRSSRAVPRTGRRPRGRPRG